MARAHHITAWCDKCEDLGLSDQPAAAEHLLAWDSEEVRRIDACPVHDHLLISLLEGLYRRGVPLKDTQEGRAKAAQHKKRKALPKAAVREAPKGAEAQELFPEAGPEAAVPEPHNEDGASKAPEVAELLCPLAHRSQGGGPKRVGYKVRGSHATEVHKLKIGDIAWEDPDGILKCFCRVHDNCKKNRLGFINETGRDNHENRA